MAKKSLGSAGSNNNDLMTRQDVLQLIGSAQGFTPAVIMPQIGRYLTMTGVYNPANEELEQGALRMSPLWVPYPGMSTDAVRMRVYESIQGQASVDYKVGIYENSSFNLPKGAPLSVSEVNLTSETGPNGGDFNFNQTINLSPGLYWIVDLPLWTGSVTRNPRVMCYWLTTIAFPTDDYNGPDVRGKNYIIYGSTQLPTSDVQPNMVSINKNNQNPLFLLRRSA